MIYNIHPIFVHFPIALLFIYSLVKLLPLSKWFPNISWKQIEILLLVTGVLGAFVALSTGDMAEHLNKYNRQIISIHSVFAGIATLLYGLILSGEILRLITPTFIPKLGIKFLTNILVYIQNIINGSVFSKIIVFLGFISIIITGMLGGAIVYGVSADPLTAIVLHFFGI